MNIDLPSGAVYSDTIFYVRPTYRRLERRLSAIRDLDCLRELLLAALRAADVAEFERALDDRRVPT